MGPACSSATQNAVLSTSTGGSRLIPAITAEGGRDAIKGRRCASWLGSVGGGAGDESLEAKDGLKDGVNEGIEIR